jgi:hypothetical protein
LKTVTLVCEKEKFSRQKRFKEDELKINCENYLNYFISTLRNVIEQ